MVQLFEGHDTQFHVRFGSWCASGESPISTRKAERCSLGPSSCGVSPCSMGKARLSPGLVGLSVGLTVKRGLGQPPQRLACGFTPGVAGHHGSVVPSALVLDGVRSELLRRPFSGPCRSGRCVRYTHPRGRRYCRRSSRSAQRSRGLACCALWRIYLGYGPGEAGVTGRPGDDTSLAK